ncbi:hypothetical protein EXIGLDRAFT_480079 [Exidia glandulosa HHB12029]|uniref:Uncharacterized protein n=1 Tax=Exidia glandulosa HHB12029 TaxID=1314781 RepID=A0A165JSH3_EXIGL|nr:hypothetical protein EXIGLDRAFT_480079 [Exidia glandulosa HHB12029]
MRSRTRPIAAAAILCSLLSVLLAFRQRGYSTLILGPSYTWLGHDFPELLPSYADLPLVELAVEESVHYPLTNSTETDANWASAAPRGYNFVHLGPKKRLFGVSMFHQLHCLRYFARAFGPGLGDEHEHNHIRHCLSYLRHAVLCSPDLTLERGDFVQRYGGGRTRTGEVHTCRDWSALYDAMDANWEVWKTDKGTFLKSVQ